MKTAQEERREELIDKLLEAATEALIEKSRGPFERFVTNIFAVIMCAAIGVIILSFFMRLGG